MQRVRLVDAHSQGARRFSVFCWKVRGLNSAPTVGCRSLDFVGGQGRYENPGRWESAAYQEDDESDAEAAGTPVVRQPGWLKG